MSTGALTLERLLGTTTQGVTLTVYYLDDPLAHPPLRLVIAFTKLTDASVPAAEMHPLGNGEARPRGTFTTAEVANRAAAERFAQALKASLEQREGAA